MFIKIKLCNIKGIEDNDYSALNVTKVGKLSKLSDKTVIEYERYLVYSKLEFDELISLLNKPYVSFSKGNDL